MLLIFAQKVLVFCFPTKNRHPCNFLQCENFLHVDFSLFTLLLAPICSIFLKFWFRFIFINQPNTMFENFKVISIVRHLTRKIENQISAAPLLKYTYVSYDVDIESCWSSSFSLLSTWRYISMRKAINLATNDEIFIMPLNEIENASIDGVCDMLKKLDFASKKLQNPSISKWNKRSRFDGVLRCHHSTDDGLNLNFEFSVSLNFELAWVKIRGHMEFGITALE